MVIIKYGHEYKNNETNQYDTDLKQYNNLHRFDICSLLIMKICSAQSMP